MTQKEMVREYLEKHGSITSWQAITEMHITRLSAHIHSLKHKDGLKIDAELITEHKDGRAVRYTKYTMEAQ